MDSITHAALGAAVGELMLGKKLGNRALVWGALFAILPDLEILLYPFLDTARYLAFQRGPSHSLFLLALISAAIAPWLAKRWKKSKVTKGLAGVFVFAAAASHVLLDCFTARGADALWPLAGKRIAFDSVFAIDPLVTLPLLVTVIWLAFLRTKKQLPKRRKLCFWGLGLSAGYLVLTLLVKNFVATGFEADLKHRRITFARRFEAPAPIGILLWRSVVDRGDEFWIGYRSLFELPDTPVRWTIYPKNSSALFPFVETREAKTLVRSTDGWWIARPHAKGVWVADLRLGETKIWGERKGLVDDRFEYSWVFTPAGTGDKLRLIQLENRHSGEVFKRMAQRVFGNREAWDGPPRLAGIHGSLPEILRSTE